MTHAQIQYNDSLGDFCQRHGLSREAFFAMNPEVEPLPMTNGLYTAELLPWQIVRVSYEAEILPSIESDEAMAVTTSDANAEVAVGVVTAGVLLTGLLGIGIFFAGMYGLYLFAKDSLPPHESPLTMTFSSVFHGETMGEFCSRNGLTRCALLALNPHLTDRLERLVDGTPTARLWTDEKLRVYASAPATFGGVSKEEVDAYRTCWKSGGVTEIGEAIKDGCGQIVDRSGVKYIVFPNGGEKMLAPENEALIVRMRECASKGGVLLTSTGNDVGEETHCYPLEANSSGTYKPNMQAEIALDADKPPQEGMSMGTKALFVLGGFAAAFAVIKYVL